MNQLQLAIDIGRVIAQSKYGKSSDDLSNAAFSLGLGYGCGDRRKIELDDAAKYLLGLI